MNTYFALWVILRAASCIADPEILNQFEVEVEGGGVLHYKPVQVLEKYKPEEATMVIKVQNLDDKDDPPIVIKIEIPTTANLKLAYSYLQNEWKSNQYLKQKVTTMPTAVQGKNGRVLPGIVAMYFFGRMKLFKGDENKYRVLGMEFQPQDLHNFIFPNGKFLAQEPDLIHKFLLQLLQTLKLLATLGFIYRDVKPKNILVTKELELLLIDFAYANFEGSDIPIDATGTIEFASLSVHELKTVCRSDDPKSLGYTHIKIKQGSLSWDTFGDNLNLIQGAKRNFGAEIMKAYPIGNKYQVVGTCLSRLMSLKYGISQEDLIKFYDEIIPKIQTIIGI